MPKQIDPPVLLGGPYHPPACRAGDWLDDEIDGRLEVGSWTSAPIPWPRRKKTGRASLILTAELARAVRAESEEAICHWWGVSAGTVWKWRKALGVGRVTEGTRKLLQERTGVPPEAAARGRERAASAESRAKMAESKRGRPMPETTRAALFAATSQPKPFGWGVKANAWMLGRQFPPPPNTRLTDSEKTLLAAAYPHRTAAEIAEALGRKVESIEQTAWRMGLHKRRFWTAEEDQLLATSPLPMKDLAALLGRTPGAIYTRRSELGITPPGHASKGLVPACVPLWDAQSDELLRTSYGKENTAALAEKLGRPVGAVRLRAIKLRLTKPRKTEQK